MSGPELSDLLSSTLPEMSTDDITWVKPHRANALYVLRAAG